MVSRREVLPWSTWPMTTTTGARGSRSSSLSSAVSMRRSSMVMMTSFSTLQPISSAMMAAVSKSMMSLREAMTPFLIRHLTTSAPVFFIREASSPTPISSGMSTFVGAFLAISSWRRRIRSCSSWRRLPDWPRPPCWRRCWLFCWIFCLPPRTSWRRWSVKFSSRSSYLSRFTAGPPRVSTTFFWGTRLAGCWMGCPAGRAPSWVAAGCCFCPWAGFFSPLGWACLPSALGAGSFLDSGSW